VLHILVMWNKERKTDYQKWQWNCNQEERDWDSWKCGEWKKWECMWI